MEDERPYLANYVIALMLVMSIYLFSNSVASFLYPDIFTSPSENQKITLILIMMSIWELIIAIMLFFNSGIAYRLAVITLTFIVVILGIDLILKGVFEFDNWLHIILSSVSFVILLTPGVREFYKEPTLPKMRSMEN